MAGKRLSDGRKTGYLMAGKPAIARTSIRPAKEPQQRSQERHFSAVRKELQGLLRLRVQVYHIPQRLSSPFGIGGSAGATDSACFSLDAPRGAAGGRSSPADLRARGCKGRGAPAGGAEGGRAEGAPRAQQGDGAFTRRRPQALGATWHEPRPPRLRAPPAAPATARRA